MSAELARRYTTPLPTRVRPWLRRLASALGLLVLAPFVGEYLLGNVSIREIAGLPVLALLYGGGALLIREVARQTGRGWPTILLLGAAYGVIEAGLVDQSLFNTSFEGWDFQDETFVRSLGFSAFNAISFPIGHAVWSIGVPISLVELLTPARRTRPWFGKGGLIVIAALYLTGCYLVFAFISRQEEYLAPAGHLFVAALVAAALIALAFIVRSRRATPTARWIPGSWPLGLGTFLLTGAHAARPESWVGFAFGIALLIVAASLIGFWSRQAGWSSSHQFALTAGALLTNAWLGFVLTLLIAPGDLVRWAGNIIFALLAIGLLLRVAHRVRQRSGSPDVISANMRSRA